MKLFPRFVRRSLVLTAVLLASTAVVGFSQGLSGANAGQPSQEGVLVISVQTGSPADKAGLARGDIILDINGKAVNSVKAVREAVSSHKQGDTISVKVRHGDAVKTLSVVLGQQDGHPHMGALLLPDESARTGMLGPRHESWPLALSGGAVIDKVRSGGPAAKAGIAKGDVILSVDGIQVTPDSSLTKLIQDKKIGQTVTLSVVPRGEVMMKGSHDVKVTLGSTPDKKEPWLGVEYQNGFPMAFLAPWRDFSSPNGIQTPTIPSLPTMAISPEAPSSMTYSSEMIDVVGK